MSPINGVSPAQFPSALTSGQAALSGANQRLAVDAGQIAAPGTDDVTAALVDASQTLLVAAVAATIIKSSDQLLGTLLNTHA